MTSNVISSRTSTTPFHWFATALLLPVLLYGCTPSIQNSEHAHAARHQPKVNQQIMAQAIPADDLMPRLEGIDVVLVGEQHDQLHHHLLQLDVIRKLHQKHPNLIVGVEFFQRPSQVVLDAFITGEIGEGELLRRSEYFDRWRFDYRLYKPVMDYLREHKIPVYALNLSSEITATVSAQGYDGLTAAQKSEIPATIDRQVPGYRERIEAVFAHHPNSSSEKLERFIEVQLLWDEGMADKAAQALQAHPGAPMVILAGAGHVEFGTGIATRLQRRIPDKQLLTVMPLDAARYAQKTPADVIVKTEKQSLPASGKMGVQLDTTGVQLRIEKVMQGSAAQQAQVPENTFVTALDGIDISSYGDLRIALLGKIPGDQVTVTIRDGEAAATRDYRLTLQ